MLPSIFNIRGMLDSLVVLSCLIGCPEVNAQRGRDLGWVKGTVVDASTKEPISFARIIFSTSATCDTSGTDFDGFYLLRTPKRKLTLRVEQIGYETFWTEIEPKDAIIFQDIALVPVK